MNSDEEMDFPCVAAGRGFQGQRLMRRRDVMIYTVICRWRRLIKIGWGVVLIV